MSEPLFSQNGWKIRPRSELVSFTAAGELFLANNRSAAVCAQYLLNEFNQTVEPIKGPVLDDWSYALRPVRGQTTGYSNHASATAWDVNALAHGRGAQGTFSPAKVKAIRKILAALVDKRGIKCFRWGGDYKSPSIVDAMHFEIIGSYQSIDECSEIIKALQKEKDMQWTDKVKLTEKDAAIWGTNLATNKPYKAGDEVSLSEMLRYPTLARKIEKELKAENDSLRSDVAALSKKIDQILAAVRPAAPKPGG